MTKFCNSIGTLLYFQQKLSRFESPFKLSKKKKKNTQFKINKSIVVSKRKMDIYGKE